MPGDTDYTGIAYATVRRPDPRIAAYVHAALGDARTVVNVGAGAGSYEPDDRHVIAVEPSEAMRAQRPRERVPAIHGIAEALPLDDGSVDAAMATVTVHQWDDLAAGLRELRRVARDRVVLLTFDPGALHLLWLGAYVPEITEVERRRYPTLATLADLLGGSVEVTPVPIPADCVDGFGEAFYARPEAFLDPAVRQAQSAWALLPPGVEERAVAALADDLRSGAWDERYGALREEPEFHGSLRLVVSS